MKTLAEMWQMNLRRNPRSIAAVFGDEKLSYETLLDRSARLASSLARLGVRHGDRVSFLSRNRLEWYAYYAAAELFGFIAATVNFRLAPPEMGYILADSDPHVLIFENVYSDAIGSIRVQLPGIAHYVCLDKERPDWALYYGDLIASGDGDGIEVTPAPDDIVRIMYTSGTTGLPKGVARSQYADLYDAQAVYTNAGMRPLGSCLMSMPLFHLGGQTTSSAMHWGGGTIHLHTAFDPLEVLRTIEREKIEQTLMAPVMLQQVLDVPGVEKFDVSSLKAVNYSAAPMSVGVLKRALQIFGPIFINVYAQTETGQGTVMHAREHCVDGSEIDIQRLNSVGRENQFSAVRIVDDEGKDCPPGQPGEILVKSQATMSFYWNNSPATANTKRDEWVHTGDIGKFDEDRFVYLVDRKKDVIISGGENIYSREVENTLLTCPGVKDVAVIGIPHEKWGETVKAIVVRDNPALTEAAILAHCDGRLARFKHPKAIAFIDELPRLPSGKVHKVTLRQTHGA